MNNSKTEIKITPFIICLAIFLAFTLAVAFFDVQNIGFNSSSVGFASINSFVHSILPGSQFAYLVSEIIGYIAIVMALIVGLVSVRNLKGKKYLYTCIFYGSVVFCYIILK